jgi:hypothetical protein
MVRGSLLAAVLGMLYLWPIGFALAEIEQPLAEAAESREPQSDDAATDQAAEPTPQPAKPRQEKLARIWANEPPLVRLARDKFGDELTETDAKFFSAVAANDWADFRPSTDADYDPEQPNSWSEAPSLQADRIAWLCHDTAASRLVPSQGMWIKGLKIVGKVDLYRAAVPFSITFNQCLLDNGINIRNAKLQELTITDCCSNRIDARGVQVAENVYMMRTAVFGGIDFIEAQIAGDLDVNGGLVFHGTTPEDAEKQGVAIDLYDAKIDGDIKLNDNFRAVGKVRLTGVRIGRSLDCSDGKFTGLGDVALDAERAQIGRSVTLSGTARFIGCVNIRRAHIGSDLECDGANLSGGQYSALCADFVDIGGQVQLGKGFHAEGEVRFINAAIAKDVDCDNGHFINPAGNALSFDSSVIGRSLRIGYDANAANEQVTDLQPGFVAKGAVRLYGTQVSQDLLAAGGQFEMPESNAIVASNLRVANRMQLSGAEVKGMIDLASADIEHELDLRGSHFDGTKSYNRIAVWANGLKVHGHFKTCQVDEPEKTWPFRVDGQASFNFATIGMSWDLYGAQFHNPNGDALDASDCQVGGYVNLDQCEFDGRMTFSRAKIDGMWILTHTVKPENLTLDMRFAHVWVIKDDKLDDWPPAGQLQLEGFVYDHFDDDSPLTVDDRLAWLRRQYAPAVRRGSPDPVAAADRRSPVMQVSETFGQINMRGQGIRAQQEQTRAPQVIPIGYDEAADSAMPYMAEPEPNTPSEDDIFAPLPTDGAESTAPVAQSTAPGTSIAPGMAAPSEDEEPVAEADESAVASTPAQPTSPVDPAGRRYVTQPYTQLASVYRAIGQDEQANAVLVARAERLGELASPFSAEALWYRYIGKLIGYGYEPFRAIKIGAVIVLLGAIIFAIGAQRNLMAETKLAEHVLAQENEPRIVPTSYPRFNAFVYSLDVFLPFVDLHQLCYWIPGERATKPRSRNCLMHIGPYSVKWSGILRTYLWFQTLAGWTLCTLLAAAVTGIVQS